MWFICLEINLHLLLLYYILNTFVSIAKHERLFLSMAPWWHACMPVLHVYPCLKLQLFIPRGSAEYCISSLKYQPINWFNISYSRLWPGRINQWKPHLILTSPNTKQQSLFVSARALWCTIHTCVSAEVYVSQYHKETTEKAWVYRMRGWGCDIGVGKTSRATNG